MKNVTKHTGKLEVIGRSNNNGRNSNPRYIVRFDGCTAHTAIDSMLGYSITNYDGKKVSALIGTYYGTVTIENVKEDKQ
jgi:hypothetical protein